MYGPSSFRATKPEVRRQYFSDRGDGAHVVDSIKSKCHFGQTNLLHEEKVRLVGRQDVILPKCSDYLDPHARRRVIELFTDRLILAACSSWATPSRF